MSRGVRAESKTCHFVSDLKMNSSEEVPKRAKKPKQIRDMIGAKRRRLSESSDEEGMQDKPFGNDELQALFESGDELEYLPLPVIRDTTDQMGNVVEFEELCVDGERTGYIRCKTKTCESKKDAELQYGHFKAHQTESRKTGNVKIREYKKSLLDRHIARWHTGKVGFQKQKASSSGIQPKLGAKFGFQMQLSQKFKTEYKKKTMNLISKKGLPLNFCEDESFKDWSKSEKRSGFQYLE